MAIITGGNINVSNVPITKPNTTPIHNFKENFLKSIITPPINVIYSYKKSVVTKMKIYN